MLPSLIGWALLLPPLLAGGSIRIALILLGLVIMITPLADLRVGDAMRAITGWARLRWALSLGLGGLTLVLGLIAPLNGQAGSSRDGASGAGASPCSRAWAFRRFRFSRSAAASRSAVRLLPWLFA